LFVDKPTNIRCLLFYMQPTAILPSCTNCLFSLKLKLNYDRNSVGQSGTHLGPATNFFFLLEIFFRQLRVCYFVAPSLTRGRVCILLLLLVLASAVSLRFKSHGTQDHILFFQFLRLPQPGEPGPPGRGWPRYTPRYWVPFPSPLTTRRATVEVF
jgi:hypothetical protein